MRVMDRAKRNSTGQCARFVMGNDMCEKDDDGITNAEVFFAIVFVWGMVISWVILAIISA